MLCDQKDAPRVRGDDERPRARPADAPAGAWVEIKTINGHRYRYLRWRDNGVRRSRYLGRADDERL